MTTGISISFVHGNLLAEELDAVVNPVNCVGVMGAGLALQFKTTYPAMFVDYQRACRDGLVQPGKIARFESSDKIIYNFPTKRHWKDKSRLQDVIEGLRDLVQYIKIDRPRSIGIPALGCGLGGLAWSKVKPIIVAEMQRGGINYELEIYIFEPK